MKVAQCGYGRLDQRPRERERRRGREAAKLVELPIIVSPCKNFSGIYCLASVFREQHSLLPWSTRVNFRGILVQLIAVTVRDWLMGEDREEVEIIVIKFVVFACTNVYIIFGFLAHFCYIKYKFHVLWSNLWLWLAGWLARAFRLFLFFLVLGFGSFFLPLLFNFNSTW